MAQKYDLDTALGVCEKIARSFDEEPERVFTGKEIADLLRRASVNIMTILEGKELS